MNADALLSVAILALTCWAAGVLGGFCWGRFGWRWPIEMPSLGMADPSGWQPEPEIARPPSIDAARPDVGATIH